MSQTALPVIEMSSLFEPRSGQRERVAAELGEACKRYGFFYLSGHGIRNGTLESLDRASRAFFALPEKQKMEIPMARAGQAWRGFFPLGGELTSGKPDDKEGVYFGVDLPADDARVKTGLPLHGANLYPAQVPELKDAVDAYMREATRAAHALLEGISLSLGLDAGYFHQVYTQDPTVLFRIFHYPAVDHESESWGVGEHTDYGLLTLLAQDEAGGLQVKIPEGWIDVPPRAGTLVCNIGDMLDKLTGGHYRSVPHRVKNISGKSRLSFPLFFDPGFQAVMEPLPAARARHVESGERWDRANIHAFTGTYGDYLMAKIGKVFPELGKKYL